MLTFIFHHHCSLMCCYHSVASCLYFHMGGVRDGKEFLVKSHPLIFTGEPTQGGPWLKAGT